jgi:enoyl-[acyl-carrier protein] reductase I
MNDEAQPRRTTEEFFAQVRERVLGPDGPLEGKKALILGIANDQSIAYGCAMAMKAFGADIAMTYLNEKTKQYTQSIADRLGVDPGLYVPCDVTKDGELEAVFEAVAKHWGKLDIALHSIAFAPREDLHGRVVDCSKEGFTLAMQVSCYSFIHMARLAEPLMTDGGSLVTMTYHGADRVIDHYNVMGPVKAALQSAAMYLAAELGPKGIRVHPISPGPLKTRAASGISNFDELMEHAASRAPARALCTIEDIGMATAFLCTDYAKMITGDVMYIDGGYHIVG